MLNKKGIAIPVILRSTLIKGAQGKVVEAIGIVEDLRKDKGERILEQKVRETQETLHNILANSGDAIITADANGRITLVNEELLQMLGFKKDELVGQHLTALSPYKGSFITTTGEKISFGEEYINYQVEKANELFEKGKVSNYELYFTRKDGMVVPIEATLSLLKDQQGERRGSIAICRDITERKKLENDLKTHLDDLELRNKERQILLDITQNLYLAETLDDILNIAIEGIKPLFSSLGNIALLNDDNKSTRIARVYMNSKILAKIERLLAAPATGYEVLLEEGNVYTKQYKNNLPIVANVQDLNDSEDVIQTDMKTVIRDFFKKKSAKRKLISTLENLTGYQSAISIPFVSEKGNSFGNIAIADYRILTANDYYLLKIYANIISSAIERKKVETELKEANDFLENIFKTSLDGIIVADNEGLIAMTNKATEKMLGYSKNELIGKSSSVLNPKGKKYQEHVNKYLTKLFKETIVKEFEFTWLKKDGNLIDVEVNAALLRDKEGNVTSVTTVRDITERKKVEESLRESEERYQDLIEFANVGIIATDDGKITQVNRIAEETYGYYRDELLGKPASVLTLEKYREQHREMLDEMIKLGKAEKAIFEEEGVRKDGTLFPVEISFSFAKPGGNIIIAVMRDITERKNMEHKLLQSEKLRSLGELSGGG